MARVVSLFLPFWPTERMQRHTAQSGGEAGSSHEAGLVLSRREGGRRIVFALDPKAMALGLRRGMAIAKAQALVPGLTVLEADPSGDAAGLERLAFWALQHISPLVAVDPPDGLVMETSGADHLHGGEAGMLRFLVSRLAQAGLTARAAVAESRGAAHAAARFGKAETMIVTAGGARGLLCPLPLNALRLDKALVQDMRRMGFERVADLLDKPRAPLVQRFGPEPGLMLDRALGLLPEPFQPLRPPEPLDVRRIFGEPIGAQETIIRYLSKLAVLLCADLERRGLGARRLDLVFRRVDGGLRAVRAGTAAPLRDATRIVRLLSSRLDTVDPGFGIEEMILSASHSEPFENRQAVSSLVAAVEPDLSGLIDVLANRPGVRRLYRFAPVASDVPERSFRRVPPLAPVEMPGWGGDWPRPARLLPRPERIETMALLPDQPPVWFSWRGARRRVARADGPERIFGEWWKRSAEREAVRDYFRVEDEAGERYWIYRSGDGEHSETGSHDWFLHGIFG